MPDTHTDTPGGPGDAIGKAMENAPEAAMQGLNRAREMVQETIQQMQQAMAQAGDAIREGLPDVAGQGAATIVPHANDALAHLPEVWS